MGIDIPIKSGSNLYSPDGGTIEKIVRNSAKEGNMIQVRASDGTLHMFMHLSTINVTEGQRVGAGQEIGKTGNTGHSTGDHLHWAVMKDGRYVDPKEYMGQRSAPSVDRESFAKGVLKNLNAPASPKNVAFMLAWMDQEGSKAAFNPFATTWKKEGATDYNKAGVKNYASAAEGMEATAKTIDAKDGRYRNIVSNLRADRADAAARYGEFGTWTKEGNYGSRIAARMQQHLDDPNLRKRSPGIASSAKNVDGTYSVASKTSTSSDKMAQPGDAVESFFGHMTELMPTLSSINPEAFGTQGVKWLGEIGFKVS